MGWQVATSIQKDTKDLSREETLFMMAFGTEIRVSAYHTLAFNQGENDCDMSE